MRVGALSKRSEFYRCEGNGSDVKVPDVLEKVGVFMKTPNNTQHRETWSLFRDVIGRLRRI